MISKALSGNSNIINKIHLKFTTLMNTLLLCILTILSHLLRYRGFTLTRHFTSLQLIIQLKEAIGLRVPALHVDVVRDPPPQETCVANSRPMACRAKTVTQNTGRTRCSKRN